MANDEEKQHESPVWHVDRQYWRSGERRPTPETEEGLLEVKGFVTAPAKVTVSLGLTLNLGNMEFARIEVGLSEPCYREESEAAFQYAKKWVEDRLKAEVREVRTKSPTSSF